MFNSKTLVKATLACLLISPIVHADMSNWFKNKNTSQEVMPQQSVQEPVQQQAAPTEAVLDQQVNRSQTPVNQPSYSTGNQSQSSSGQSSSGLEQRMNYLNSTISKLSQTTSQTKDELTSNYLNIVQFIVINDATKQLDGKDNRSTINNMLAGVIGCQNKYNINVIQTTNNSLPSDVARIVNNYLTQNIKTIPSQPCVY